MKANGFKDAKSRDASGNTALMRASEHGNYTVVKQLMERGADVHAEEGDSRRTALHKASEAGQADVVKLLDHQVVGPCVCVFVVRSITFLPSEDIEYFLAAAATHLSLSSRCRLLSTGLQPQCALLGVDGTAPSQLLGSPRPG